MSARRKRYCVRGHDTWVRGRAPNYECWACRYARIRVWRQTSAGKAAIRRSNAKQGKRVRTNLSKVAGSYTTIFRYWRNQARESV